MDEGSHRRWYFPISAHSSLAGVFYTLRRDSSAHEQAVSAGKAWGSCEVEVGRPHWLQLRGSPHHPHHQATVPAHCQASCHLSQTLRWEKLPTTASSLGQRCSRDMAWPLPWEHVGRSGRSWHCREIWTWNLSKSALPWELNKTRLSRRWWERVLLCDFIRWAKQILLQERVYLTDYSVQLLGLDVPQKMYLSLEAKTCLSKQRCALILRGRQWLCLNTAVAEARWGSQEAWPLFMVKANSGSMWPPWHRSPQVTQHLWDSYRTSCHVLSLGRGLSLAWVRKAPHTPHVSSSFRRLDGGGRGVLVLQIIERSSVSDVWQESVCLVCHLLPLKSFMLFPFNSVNEHCWNLLFCVCVSFCREGLIQAAPFGVEQRVLHGYCAFYMMYWA